MGVDQVIGKIEQGRRVSAKGIVRQVIQYRDKMILSGHFGYDGKPASPDKLIAFVTRELFPDAEFGFSQAEGYVLSEADVALVATEMSRLGPCDIEIFSPTPGEMTGDGGFGTHTDQYWSQWLVDPSLSEYRDDIHPLIVRECGGGEGEGPLRILDVGCGEGHLLKLLGERFPDAELYGIDYSEGNVTFAHSQVDTGRGEVVVGDVRRLGQYFVGEKFDLVVCSGVLTQQVIVDPMLVGAVLDGMVEKMNPGGQLIATGKMAPSFRAADLTSRGIDFSRHAFTENTLRKPYSSAFYNGVLRG